MLTVPVSVTWPGEQRVLEGRKAVDSPLSQQHMGFWLGAQGGSGLRATHGAVAESGN